MLGKSWENHRTKSGIFSSHVSLPEGKENHYFLPMFHWYSINNPWIIPHLLSDLIFPYYSHILIYYSHILIYYSHILIFPSMVIYDLSINQPFSAVGCFAPCLWWHWHLRCAAQRPRCLEWGPACGCSKPKPPDCRNIVKDKIANLSSKCEYTSMMCN